VRSEADLLEPAAQLLLFRQRARSVTLTAAEMVMKLLSKGVSFDEAWNKSMVELLRAARAHCELALVIYFQQAITNVPAALRTVLKRLCDLFVLHTAENALDDLLELGALAPQQAPLVRGAVRSLLHALRPDAVALVDAFNYTDRQLNSALGRYDGRVYEAMVEAVKRSPLNASDVVQGYEEHLKPLLNRQVLRGKL
jgi:acyl-CoA oxidase